MLRDGRDFIIGDHRDLGILLPEAAAELAKFPTIFEVRDDAVELLVTGDVETRSREVAKTLEVLRDSDRVAMLRGWRGEGWPVKTTYDAPAELVIERAAGPLFGVRGYGCHVNGLVNDGRHLWVARRSASKQTYPGKLDHIVAGGLSHGEQPSENVVRECAEEANIPGPLARRARPTSIIEYCQLDETGWGIKQDTIFCYDLDLPSNFEPTAADGEVESFSLWKVEDVIESIAADNDDWKPNVALVIIDMLVRRGLVSPDERGYVDLVRSLRQ
eukprot:TRINITY_DN16958_c0_g1_i2.p1 TRINITY_DN16958_c0_g1~~TRINITY_DN16958_c0_g1_i2.p1  ORF type:complete len:273 (+),score=49.21 TRINITY_DN16958_c0_g1_i2:451-1269(+)